MFHHLLLDYWNNFLIKFYFRCFYILDIRLDTGSYRVQGFGGKFFELIYRLLSHSNLFQK